MGRSVTSGLTNAVSSAIYGTNPLNSVKEAIGRGAGAGAATAAINNLSDAWRNRGNHDTKPHVLTGTGSNYLPGTRQDPKTCNIRSPFNGNIGYNGGNGYQYEVKGSSGKTGFSLGDFCKDVLVGTVMGGLSSAAFYGGGKALEKLGNSIKGGSKTNIDNPLENIKYTDKVKNQMRLGDYHSFPESVEGFGGNGKITTVTGGDKITRTKIEISGSYAGKDGVFQYIIEPDGVTCNHRLFVSNH